MTKRRASDSYARHHKKVSTYKDLAGRTKSLREVRRDEEELERGKVELSENSKEFI